MTRCAPPDAWRTPGPRSRPELLTVAGENVCAALPDEIESGNLRALINLSGHLLACMPDADRMTAALRSLEILATIEILDNTMRNNAFGAVGLSLNGENVTISGNEGDSPNVFIGLVGDLTDPGDNLVDDVLTAVLTLAP